MNDIRARPVAKIEHTCLPVTPELSFSRNGVLVVIKAKVTGASVDADEPDCNTADPRCDADNIILKASLSSRESLNKTLSHVPPPSWIRSRRFNPFYFISSLLSLSCILIETCCPSCRGRCCDRPCRSSRGKE
jgi:hypothetical protein